MAGMLMGVALLLSLLKGSHVVQVAHVNIWEEALHQVPVVASTVELMVTGQETVRLVTGKTNATVVEKEGI